VKPISQALDILLMYIMVYEKAEHLVCVREKWYMKNFEIKKALGRHKCSGMDNI
jgi:hypothetical protein